MSLDIDTRPWRPLRLAEHFTLGEFAVSSGYPALAAGITFTGGEVCRLHRLVGQFLEPLRRAFGPVEILSGKRSDLLNRAVGGATLSDHLMLGLSCAADFHVGGLTPWQLGAWVLAHARLKNLLFKQLILYPSGGFVHLSLPDESGKTNRILEFRGRNRYLTLTSEQVFERAA
jgi:hypothetical protein